MALPLVVPPPNDKKRVKVYELKNNDWFDRGTGFCTGRIVNVRGNPQDASIRLCLSWYHGCGLLMTDDAAS